MNRFGFVNSFHYFLVIHDWIDLPTGRKKNNFPGKGYRQRKKHEKKLEKLVRI